MINEDVRNDGVGEGGDGTDPSLPAELPEPPARADEGEEETDG